MKERLEKIKEDLVICQKSFNLVSSRCKYASLEGHFRNGYECMHPIRRDCLRPQQCDMSTCAVMHNGAEY